MGPMGTTGAVLWTARLEKSLSCLAIVFRSCKLKGAVRVACYTVAHATRFKVNGGLPASQLLAHTCRRCCQRCIGTARVGICC